MIQKMIALILIINITATVHAQCVFDSVSYVNRYSNIFPSFNYGNSIDRRLTTAEKIAGLSKVWSEAKFGFANFDLEPANNFKQL